MKWDLRRWDFVCAIQCFVVSTIGLYLFAYRWGQDTNYDLMNYHHFSPFAFFSKDQFQNITTKQQFLNPIIYIPHYEFLNNFGLRQDGIDCVHFPSFIGANRVGLALCPVYRSDTGAPASAPTYPIGRTLIFGQPGRNSLFYEFSGWGIRSDVGRAWDPSAKELHLRLEIMQTPPEKLALNFSLVVPRGQCNFNVTINGTSVFEARNAENCDDGKFEIALPTGVVGFDRLLDIAFVRFALPSSANEPIVIQNFDIRPL